MYMYIRFAISIKEDTCYDVHYMGRVCVFKIYKLGNLLVNVPTFFFIIFQKSKGLLLRDQLI